MCVRVCVWHVVGNVVFVLVVTFGSVDLVGDAFCHACGVFGDLYLVLSDFERRLVTHSWIAQCACPGTENEREGRDGQRERERVSE